MDPRDAPGRTDYRALARRMGRDLLERRIRKQAGFWAKEIFQGEGILAIERVIPVNKVVACALRLMGLAEKGRRNCLDIRVEENELLVAGLPGTFEGYRILQISDLHCDLLPELTSVVQGIIEKVDFDFAVLTGDYHGEIGEDFSKSMELMRGVLELLRGRCVGILGNHDFIEKAVFLEETGLPLLLNENMRLERDGQSLWIAGVDDPHFFETHNLVAARAGIPDGVAVILLAHSPEIYREAEALGYSAMLSGHTHGGQICLPGGHILLRNAPCPREMLAGPWRYKHLSGYTSRGTGSSGVAARFHCPPEVTLHTLRRSQD